MVFTDTPWFWLFAVVGIVLTGISKSGFAGGAGVVAVPLLALVMPVPYAAALVLPLLLVMDAKTVLFYRHSIDLRAIRAIGLASLVGIAVAGLAMAALTSAALQRLLALFCIVFASGSQWAPWLGRWPGAAYLWGALSGVSSTLLHAGGPPISIYFLSKGLSKKDWLAQAAIFFALMNLVKVVPYSLNHAWRFEFLIIDLILLPVALLGVYLGHKIQAYLSEAAFTKSCRALLGVTGVLLLLKSFV